MMVVNWGWLSLLRAANDGDMIGNVNMPPAQNLRALQWMEIDQHVERTRSARLQNIIIPSVVEDVVTLKAEHSRPRVLTV